MDACLDSFEGERGPGDIGPRNEARDAAPPPATPAPDAAADSADAAPVRQAVSEWGFIDEHGGIWQNAGAHGAARLVGQLRSANAVAALEVYVRRFLALEQRCAAFEERVRGSARPGHHLEAVRREVEHLRGASAIGDVDALLERWTRVETEILAAQGQQRARKEEICAAAEQLRDSTAWRATAEQIRALQSEWKGLGSAGREEDALLWQRFHAAASGFFERRAADLAERTQDRREARARKEALCDQANALAESDDWRRASAFFAAIVDEWRAAGSAGREDDQALWRRLGAARRRFFRRRTSAFKLVQKERRANYERKEALCAAAESLAQTEPSNGALKTLQGLQAEWTNIGPAGPRGNAEIWRRFRAACGAAYARLREHRERRREEWLGALRDAHARKSHQVQSLEESVGRDEGHVTRWRQALDRLRGGPGANEIRGRLEERIGDVENRLRAKSQRLAELRASLSDIEARLNSVRRRGRAAAPPEGEPPEVTPSPPVD